MLIQDKEGNKALSVFLRKLKDLDPHLSLRFNEPRTPPIISLAFSILF